MTELLLQSSISLSRDKQLATEVDRLKQHCTAEHGSNNNNTTTNNGAVTKTSSSPLPSKSIIDCPECYGKIIDLVQARYVTKPAKDEGSEWFTGRTDFLKQLKVMFNVARARRLDPRKIDERIQDERSLWYLENVRASLLRGMEGDPDGKQAILDKLDDDQVPPVLKAEIVGNMAGDILSKGIASETPANRARMEGVADRLVGAKDEDERIEVLKDAFFGDSRNDADEKVVVSEPHQRFFDMLKNGETMQQVVDRVIEARTQADKLRTQAENARKRLDDLHRAKAAYYKKKARNQKLAAEQKISDEMYNLPGCAECGGLVSFTNHKSCPVCAILADKGIAGSQRTVWCSTDCFAKGDVSFLSSIHPLHFEATSRDQRN